jgi:hypothetical protein
MCCQMVQQLVMSGEQDLQYNCFDVTSEQYSHGTHAQYCFCKYMAQSIAFSSSICVLQLLNKFLLPAMHDYRCCCRVKRGLLLVSVNGQSLERTTARQATALIRDAARPLTLRLRDTAAFSASLLAAGESPTGVETSTQVSGCPCMHTSYFQSM